MKKQFNFTLIAMLFAFVASAFTIPPDKAIKVAPDFVVITDGVVYAKADHDYDAVTVTVELIGVDGRVQASSTTTPGQTVQFPAADNSQKVRFTYAHACCIIIIYDEPMT